MLYKNFQTQEEIDQEYNPRFKAPNAQEIMDSYFESSQRIRKENDHQLDILYGPTLAEHFDFFPAKTKKAPLHVFIHGGYWRAFSSKEFSLIAEPFLKNEIHVAVINYALCPFVTIDEIVRQCRSALAFLYRNSLSLAYNPEQISISGHSAGGHLVGMMLATDWKGDYGLPQDLIKTACAISGLFDLSPFPYSWLQPQLQLTWDQVARNSPIRHPSSSSNPIIVAVGGNESNEFHSQAETYVEFLKEQGRSVEYLDLKGRDHFTILHDFLGKGGDLFQAILEKIH